jgi:putative hydrolase of the HAD superfamily
MKQYEALFFDLDHTLWDYETNSRDTLHELHKDFNLREKYGISLQQFFAKFEEVNHKLWSRYNNREINRDHIRSDRFRDILTSFYIEDEALSAELSRLYIDRCPAKTSLFPFAMDCLTYLQERYPLYILTNGFDDVQAIKLKNASIHTFFREVITSETTGHRKPSKEIFEHAVARAGVHAERCLMVGDNLQADIAGALNAGLHAAFFNPLGHKHTLRPHFEISCLSEVRNIL